MSALQKMLNEMVRCNRVTFQGHEFIEMTVFGRGMLIREEDAKVGNRAAAKIVDGLIIDNLSRAVGITEQLVTVKPVDPTLFDSGIHAATVKTHPSWKDDTWCTELFTPAISYMWFRGVEYLATSTDGNVTLLRLDDVMEPYLRTSLQGEDPSGLYAVDTGYRRGDRKELKPSDKPAPTVTQMEALISKGKPPAAAA